MTLIQSMEDLARAKAGALEQQQANDQKFSAHIRIGMSSCGIAVGARDTLEAINNLIGVENLPGIQVIQTGCIGLCALEPIVQVQVANQSPITYGKVTPQVAQRIIKEHIGNRRIVQEYVVENL